MQSSTWVFGYGSLVSPTSMARTIGRHVEPDEGWRAARLRGYGRRWNYGSKRQRGNWHGPHGHVESGVVICLGIEAEADERCNGVIVRVDHDELAALDLRESDYDRTDVTGAVTVQNGQIDGPVVTYVPRQSAIERYILARAERRAAVRQGYADLVRAAFGDLGHRDLAEYDESTPIPDVPVVEFE